MSDNKNIPMMLLILDGWGLAPKSKANPIELADKQNFDFLWENYPHTKLFAHGKHAGLPDNQVGNSEAGHLNIGAGKVVLQESVFISKKIDDGTFYKNPAFKQLITHVNKNKSELHLMGLISSESSPHMNLKHLYALAELACENCSEVYLHLFTDGRDSPQFAAIDILHRVQKKLPKKARIVSLIGRFYAMDRNRNWQRTQKAYELLTQGKGQKFENIDKAIIHSYNKGLTDEYLEPSLIVGKNEKPIAIDSNDGVVFFNLRSDRARQLTKCFVQTNFNKQNPKAFKRKKILKNSTFVALTDFGPDLDDILTAFPSITVKNTMPMLLSDFRQIYVAEGEKYAHVTYFVNGGSDKPVNGEHRLKVPSPRNEHYDEVPEMSAYKITDRLLEFLSENRYDFYFVNFANPDMIAHTGNIEEGIKAIEVIDECLGRIYEKIKEIGGVLLVTADHGNAEKMIDLETGEKFTQHTTNKVPFILVDSENIKFKSGGKLGNILPTVLDLLGKKIPKDKLKSLIK